MSFHELGRTIGEDYKNHYIQHGNIQKFRVVSIGAGVR